MTVSDLSRAPDDPREESRWEAEVDATRLGRSVHAVASSVGGVAWTTCSLCDVPSAPFPDGRGRSSCCAGPLRTQGWVSPAGEAVRCASRD